MDTRPLPSTQWLTLNISLGRSRVLLDEFSPSLLELAGGRCYTFKGCAESASPQWSVPEAHTACDNPKTFSQACLCELLFGFLLTAAKAF